VGRWYWPRHAQRRLLGAGGLRLVAAADHLVEPRERAGDLGRAGRAGEVVNCLGGQDVGQPVKLSKSL
jgi:hypothetical protein